MNTKISFKDGVVISTNPECSVVEIVNFGSNYSLDLACQQSSVLVDIANMIGLYNKSKERTFEILNQKLGGILDEDVEIVNPYDL